jgi:hypothetical protein
MENEKWKIFLGFPTVVTHNRAGNFVLLYT